MGGSPAPVALVAWGSVAGIVIEAARLARAEGLKVKALVPKLLYPFAEDVYQDFFASVRRGLVVEQSHQGQFYRVMRMFVDVPKGVESLARSGSNPFGPDEIVTRLRTMSLALQDERSPVQQVGQD